MPRRDCLPALVLLLAGALAARPGEEPRALPSMPAPCAAATEGARIEHFVLEAERPAPEVGLAGAVGVATLRRRDAGGRVTLECDLAFRDGGVRAWHVERFDARERRLVWREQQPDSGRTWMASGALGGDALLLSRWGSGARVHGELAGAAAAWLPLQLVEALRAGELRAGAAGAGLARVWPLSGRIEELTLRERAGPAPARELELLRADGSLAGSWRFEGARLLGFRWQGGGLVARRIDAQELARLVADWPPRRADAERRDVLRRWVGMRTGLRLPE